MYLSLKRKILNKLDGIPGSDLICNPVELKISINIIDFELN